MAGRTDKAQNLQPLHEGVAMQDYVHHSKIESYSSSYSEVTNV